MDLSAWLVAWTAFAVQGVKRLSVFACAAGAVPVVCESALGHQDCINGSLAGAEGVCLSVCLSGEDKPAG